MQLAKAVLASLFLVFAFTVQSGLVCSETAHVGHQHMPAHRHHRAPETPVCCWTLSTCVSPAAPLTRTADFDVASFDRTVTAARMNRPRSIVFAPETPPPRALA